MKLPRRGKISALFIIVTIIIGLILLPSLLMVAKLFLPAGESWHHIKTYLFMDYLKNSLVLALVVGCASGILGTYFSWSLAKYEWRYSTHLEVLLFLPMAIPPYIAGYIYGGIFTPFGSLDRILDTLGIKKVRIDMLSIGGAIFVFTLFLTPYVMLVTKSFFEKMPRSIEESSQLLGKNKLQTFISVILPMSSSAIIGGVVLVVLEVLNDYGLVKHFGIPTFSTAIYTTWFGLSDIDGAIRLASSLMVMVFGLLLLQQLLKGRGKVSLAKASAHSGMKKRAPTPYGIVFGVVSVVYITAALIVPVIQLILWADLAKGNVTFRHFDKVMINTLLLALVVTSLVLVAGTLIGNLNRLHSSLVTKVYARIVILGYSMPASIIAVAILIAFIALDRSLIGLYGFFGLKSLFLTGSLVMLGFALTLRFMAIGFNNIEAGFSKMGKGYYEASKLLGRGEWATFRKVDLPMLKPALISAGILTFVDVLKELPLTLILRPFNFDTLSTRVFTYAGDEMIHEASIYALIIIAVSTLALLILTYLRKERHR